MARNGAGLYSLPAGNPFITGTSISSTTMNSTLSDIANALTQSLSSDGQTTPTANLPMGNYKLTGLGNGSALQDSAALGQVQSGAVQWLTGVSGTDTITAGISPTPAAYAAGQVFRFVSAGANTGPVTLNISSLGVRNVTKTGAVALSAGDIPSGAVVEVVFDGTRFQISNVAYSLADGSVTNAKLADGAASGVKLGSKIQSISASVSANALTISASALSLDFRSTTLGSGTVTTVTGTPANLVISSGSTLGTVNAVQSDIAVLAINNAGTIELAAVNLAGGTQLDETNLISTTAEGGAGAADSSTVVYSTTARTNVAYRVLGIIRSTQTTAGTWATAPSLIQGAGGFAALQTAFRASGSAPMYACRAWVNFNGTGTVAIRASGNVSSITDNGVGDYTVNFTTAMPDADYALVASSSESAGGNTTATLKIRDSVTAPTTTAVRVSYVGSVYLDPAYAMIAIFR